MYEIYVIRKVKFTEDKNILDILYVYIKSFI